jgi:hypothetical protein
MKTFRIAIFASILMLSYSSAGVAQNNPTNKTGQYITGRNYVDKNKDGVCDNYGTRGNNAKGLNFIDKNNDGICDNNGNGSNKVKGRNFIDNNKDGVCDNRGKGRKGNGTCLRNGNGCGFGYQHRNGKRR